MSSANRLMVYIPAAEAARLRAIEEAAREVATAYQTHGGVYRAIERLVAALGAK